MSVGVPISLAFRPGEGVGPELVEVAREVADAALVACGRARVAWVADGAPSLGLLAGPMRLERPWRAASFLRIVTSAAAPWTLLADEAGGEVEWAFDDAEGAAVLAGLREWVPSVSARLRFGAPARVESHRRGLGRREPERFASTLSIATASMRGGWRFFEAAFAWLREAGVRRATLVADVEVTPRRSSAFEQAALYAASQAQGLYTWEDRSRETERYGAAVAASSEAAAAEHGLVLERRSLAASLELAWRDPRATGAVLAPWAEASALAHLLARHGGGTRRGAVVRTEPSQALCVAQALHGTADAHEGRGTADPSGMILAAAELLAWKGEARAAGLVRTALAGVAAELRGVGEVRAACLRGLEGRG
jgi:hypothetical protein